jgi:hypothetical protein
LDAFQFATTRTTLYALLCVPHRGSQLIRSASNPAHSFGQFLLAEHQIFGGIDEFPRIGESACELMQLMRNGRGYVALHLRHYSQSSLMPTSE